MHEQQASTPKARESGDLGGPVRNDSFSSSKEEDDVIRASDGAGKKEDQMQSKMNRLQTLLSGHQVRAWLRRRQHTSFWWVLGIISMTQSLVCSVLAGHQAAMVRRP